MSFVPVFSIVRIPADAKSIYIMDATPSGGSTGYGTLNAPANLSAIISKIVQITSYNGTTVTGTIIAGGNFATELGVSVTIPDGVLTVTVLYGVLVSLHGVIAADRLSMTLTGADNLFGNVKYFSPEGTQLVEVDSIIGNTITFKTAFPGAYGTIDVFYKHYAAEQKVIVLYEANRALLKEISKVSCYDDHAKKALLMMVLKQQAENEFALGNLSKANQAALLITGKQVSYTSNCSTCV